MQKLFIHGAVLLGVLPFFSVVAALPPSKQSTLPCLVGSPEFSEVLIKNNPRLSNKAYFLQDAILFNVGFNTKHSIDPLSFSGLGKKDLEKFKGKKWNDHINSIDALIGSLVKINPLVEFGVYFHRFAALYFALKPSPDSWALVVGNSDEPIGLHASIGHFPIHFGCGGSEYTLGGSQLQGDLGMAAAAPCSSLNFSNRWNIENKTKIKLFGFWQECIGAEGKYQETKGGISLNHEYKPLSKDIDSIALGISWVNGLPVTEEGFYNPDGLDGYLHINSGPLKIKLGGLIKDPKSWFKGEQKPRGASDVQTKIPDNLKDVQSGKKSKFRVIDAPSYAAHFEASYKLPFKRGSALVGGYTWGNSGFLAAKHRCFIGFKTNVLENVGFIIGYKLEESLKKEKDGNLPRGCVDWDSTERCLAKEADKRSKGDNGWHHTVTMQFNITC